MKDWNIWRTYSKDDKLNNLQDIIESQEIIDGIVVKNADDMILIEKKKEQNEESIKSLEEKIYAIDKVIATMTQNLQDQFERLREEVADNDTNVNDDIIHEIKCKYFDTGFCRLKDKCPFSHKSPKICEAYKNGTKCQSQSCYERHPKLCRYFKRGFCFRNESCLYFHSDRLETKKITKDVERENMSDLGKNTEMHDMDVEISCDILENGKDETIENIEVSVNIKESSSEMKERNVECTKCKLEEAKNECEQCGNKFCSQCEIIVHGVGVLQFFKDNNWLNYTCNTVHL